MLDLRWAAAWRWRPRRRVGGPVCRGARDVPPRREVQPRPLSPSVETWNAEALCDLISDPRSGVTGVRVVGATPLTLDAIAAVAARRGLITDEARSAALGRGRISIANGVAHGALEADAPRGRPEPGDEEW